MSWRFVSSPTIRINDVDIAFELRESSCGSEACVDGCGDHVDCRVWVFGGREYTEPPVELIVDAILRQSYVPDGDGQGENALGDQVLDVLVVVLRHAPEPPVITDCEPARSRTTPG